MLSGIWPRGSSSAPGSGSTGIVPGRSIGPRYSAFIGIALYSASRCRSRRETILAARDLIRKPVPTFRDHALRKQNRRQPLAAIQGGLVGRTPGLEELHQLLARAVLVPFAVALDDLDQVIDRLGALALGVEGYGKVEFRLMIEWIGENLFFQLRIRPERFRLLGDLECGARGRHRRLVWLGFRHQSEGLLG